MGVKVGKRKDKPGWWVFVHHNGRRTKKRFAETKQGEREARKFAEKLDARLKWADVSGESLPLTKQSNGMPFETYPRTWLERIQHTRKFSTYDSYDKMLTRELLPSFQGMALQDISRERIKDFACLKLRVDTHPKRFKIPSVG